MMKKVSLLSVVVCAVTLISACATAPPAEESSGLYTGQDHRYKKTVVLEFFKKTNKSISHNSDLALAVGSEISRAFKRVRLNLDYPSVVESEFTARGDINMVADGVHVAKRENKNLVLFLDAQYNKRGKSRDGDPMINVTISAWVIDAARKKVVAKLSKNESWDMDHNVTRTEMDDSVREAMVYTARDLGDELAGLLDDYLTAR